MNCMNNEKELLIGIIKAYMNNQTIDKKYFEKIKWEKLISLAHKQKMDVLVYNMIKDNLKGAVPDKTFKAIKDEIMKLKLYNAVQIYSAGKVVKELKDRLFC